LFNSHIPDTDPKQVEGKEGFFPSHTVQREKDTWLDRWMEGWMGGWMDGWIDGWMERY